MDDILEFDGRLALEQKRWQLLNNQEKRILFTIAVCETKEKIFQLVFSGTNFLSCKGKFIWNMINKIERLGLIQVSRNQNRIVDFNMYPPLRDALIELLSQGIAIMPQDELDTDTYEHFKNSDEFDQFAPY